MIKQLQKIKTRSENFLTNKNMFLITYKLLHDALLILLLTLATSLIAEGLLPGIISGHISLARIVLVILFILGFIVFIGQRFDLTYIAPAAKKNRLLPILILFVFLLIGNSLLNFAFWQNMLITLTTIIIFYLFYKIIFASK